VNDTVVVLGQGYVGLPLAMRSVACGFNVVGIDVDARRVAALELGKSYVEDVPDAALKAALSSGRYTPSMSFEHAAGFVVAVITVPTPLKDGLPDLSMIEGAAHALAPHLTTGGTVILESTTYPGTTEELLAPILEAGSGLRVGQGFHLGYSPERIDPGNAQWNLVNTPKVVSGIDDASLKAVKAFYDRLVDSTVVVSSCRIAEMTKLLENTFRHVNVALVNELAMFAHALDIDVWEAINAADTKPFGYMRFSPGPGVGGHCLPVDPTYLSWQVKRTLGSSFRFVELANDVNDHMPQYVVRRVAAFLNDARKAVNGSQLLLIGLAYKKNSSDARESPAVRVAQLLVQQGAEVRAVDPHVAAPSVPDGVTMVELSGEELRHADLTVLLTDHDDLVTRLSTEHTADILDTRDRLPRRPGIQKL
jgi:UDP-N-acetyl-D-mannosaminuronic acid dehydrogenase/UDP-N-acetyl-D-glucosamine dehydrogenase